MNEKKNPMLIDSHLRSHDYLRISVTDKCNLRCRYCIPPEGTTMLDHNQVLRNEEFVRLADLFASMGIKKIRFTGGEPFVRKGFIDIVEKIRKQLPDIELCVTTNGVLLSQYLDKLESLKVWKMNISLDTLSRERFKNITGFDELDNVLEAVEKTILHKNFDVKINTVLLEETIDEVDRFLEYFKDKRVTLRFIEKMPMTGDSRDMTFLPSDRFLEILKSKGTLKRTEKSDTKVAHMYQFIYKDTYAMKLGIIPPVTHKFCSQCNRLRLTCDGLLKSCLYGDSDTSLLPLVRSGAGDKEIMETVKSAVARKGQGHEIECYESETGCVSIISPAMSKIGG